MNTQRDKLWSAYLDGELSASEAAELDQSLTQDERDRLAAEVRYERALADTLVRGVRCPEAVWRRTVEAVQRHSGARSVRVWPRLAYGLTAMAALLALTVGGLVFYSSRAEPEFLRLGDVTVSALAARADLEGADLGAVNDYLLRRGFAVALRTLEPETPSHHHDRAFLGLHEAAYRGEPVMELLFACCGKPVKVVLAPKRSAAARQIGAALASGEIQASRPVGDFVAAIVGGHPTAELLDSLTEELDNAAHQA